MVIIIGYILAIAVGISLGLIGGGGSILTVPILKYVIGVETKTAIATSLAVVGVVSLIGVIPHWRQGNVNLKIALIFAPAAMIGAYLGALLTRLPFVTDTMQLVAFGVVMLVASFLMIRQKKPEKLDAKRHQSRMGLIPLQGLVVGMITAFVGAGGGFAIIPALVLWGGIPMKEAIGTSLLIIFFNSATGFAGYYNQVTLDWQLTIFFTLAASVGILAGAYLTKYVDGKQLRRGFGYFVLAVACFVLIKR